MSILYDKILKALNGSTERRRYGDRHENAVWTTN